ncbi:hypothetical protein CONPUDRAFT_151047 [Coniophora puteana RWD-64-598 SS2]|uniref:Uncharacterized protein n=1 Tax=Coniophora puteana (strain RWD-64-598) TaxID=741705 RepID=A0A5M3MY11_CONPW|nr:uncharacterized protein CONPUDRAFT_151047 [Coniophora puteana RWD-64-598 SS2]EIW84000.1 hypothetical protein CONPUDRAFT_151047 [Coniophora puteana RWD-64-598 SS2]
MSGSTYKDDEVSAGLVYNEGASEKVDRAGYNPKDDTGAIQEDINAERNEVRGKVSQGEVNDLQDDLSEPPKLGLRQPRPDPMATDRMLDKMAESEGV